MNPETREAQYQNDTAIFLAARKVIEQASATFDIAFNKAANLEITQAEYDEARKVHDAAYRIFMAAQDAYRTYRR